METVISRLRFRKKMQKYGAVGSITVRNNFAYLRSFFIRSWFLLVILFIFVQLWRITYQGEGSPVISGYTYEQMIWYLIFAESIILSSPRLSVKIEEEVIKGDVGYQLTRPMSYLLYHYFSYMGEAYVRLGINLSLGSALGITLFGWPHFGFGWLGFLLISVGSFTVNYLMTMILSLCSFWVEETRGLVFVYNKILFIIGGLMLPLEIFPGYLQTICHWLPFQTITYFAANTGVHFEWLTLGKRVLIQTAWILLLSFLLHRVYEKGVRKLHVNGG
ncbi:ABC-2 family transporter protein [Thermoactinomyces sp. CICC 10523]|uniref:ABC transporter permease n=1 Tax=Thermoactinomyces sp. CICC 10523 TaxID=2767428 RepID=UPI0018DB0941|nr:ABC-2 family transporter protein [Thermoactinomyces sp. CICC 10523]MBH8599691.1 ABC-2 family transporter protein [Thermoactinomyces sp. CICC 10523]